MLSNINFKVFIFAVILEAVLACNGFKANLIKAENCAGEDAIIKMDSDFTVKLNKKCEIVPTGCISNKAFNTAVSKFKVTKDGMVLKEGKMDLCSMADSAPAEVKDYLKVFGAPSSCPVEEAKVCAHDHKIDLSKYKALLAVARGHIVVDSDITHDTGKSCFHIELEITN
ncbi:sporozoite-associated mosquito saliva protein 1-like [Musca autumnalis]|uniref:sporozoite-associated mosquito saliva protein 1-like n=1 Tax=Musca autumnalis TaxID=221902 RepID=UPI003CF09758